MDILRAFVDILTKTHPPEDKQTRLLCAISPRLSNDQFLSVFWAGKNISKQILGYTI